MTIFVLEKPTPSLRGELSRWMIEIKAGVFVGKISTTVTSILQEKIFSTSSGAITIIRKANNEQGFSIYSIGKTTLNYIDFDGVILTERINTVSTTD